MLTVDWVISDAKSTLRKKTIPFFNSSPATFFLVNKNLGLDLV